MVITRQLVSSIAHVPEGPLCWNKDGQMIHCFEDMNVSFHSHGGSISATESTYPPASASNRDGKIPGAHRRSNREFGPRIIPRDELSSSTNSFSITVESLVADECSNNNDEQRRRREHCRISTTTPTEPPTTMTKDIDGTNGNRTRSLACWPSPLVTDSVPQMQLSLMTTVVLKELYPPSTSPHVSLSLSLTHTVHTLSASTQTAATMHPTPRKATMH